MATGCAANLHCTINTQPGMDSGIESALLFHAAFGFEKPGVLLRIFRVDRADANHAPSATEHGYSYMR
jgi:predicted GNAT superfamily acetyltransferase